MTTRRPLTGARPASHGTRAPENSADQRQSPPPATGAGSVSHRGKEVLCQAQHHLFAGAPRQTGTVRVQPHHGALVIVLRSHQVGQQQRGTAPELAGDVGEQCRLCSCGRKCSTSRQSAPSHAMLSVNSSLPPCDPRRHPRLLGLPSGLRQHVGRYVLGNELPAGTQAAQQQQFAARADSHQQNACLLPKPSH